MAKEWTKGPWRSTYDDNGFYFVDADSRPSPYICATGSEGDESEANANLIAAAPDLYEAVCSLIEGIELRLGGNVDCGWHHDPELMTRARAALSKAEGR